MRIEAIDVKNFRGIRDVVLRDLGNTVVIAGANGSGKSCIFDAIRLLKSAYGGYQQNEWHHWMAEFQINFANNAEAFTTFFQDKTKELSIECVFRLHANERAYLEKHGEELVRNSLWRLIAPEMYQWSSYTAAPMASQYRSREPEVQRETKIQWTEMLRELSQDTITGRIWAIPGKIQFTPSKALEILFSSFMPGELGLIDYHGAQRMYTREQVSGINLDLNAQTQQNKNHALYNYNAKYSNVKTEMTGSYVKELLAEKAGVSVNQQNAIEKTLRHLFKTFFPDKEFLGLQPTIDGSLTFPVKTASGAIHDLNELSAGEKEILYGYLRIRNSAPRYSVILIDEPELHLNPGLVRGLPRFYHEHLGVALDNQIWLVTHSDTLLREVIGRPEYSVFHMVGLGADKSTPQIVRLTLAEEAERAILSLVGDIAAYRPGKKIVIFEGGGDAEFDVYLVTQLFPELSEQTNVISGGNKLRVRELHNVLEATSKKGIVPFRTFSITDRDSDLQEQVTSPRFKWNVYHIENYLLEARFIWKLLLDLNAVPKTTTDSDVYDRLRAAASATLSNLVRHELTEYANKELVSSIDLSFNPNRTDIAVAISEAVTRSMERLMKAQSTQLAQVVLVPKEAELATKFRNDLATDAWRSSFRGRDVLREFVKNNAPIPYDAFRDLLIAGMKNERYQPPGIKLVVDQILAA